MEQDPTETLNELHVCHVDVVSHLKANTSYFFKSDANTLKQLKIYVICLRTKMHIVSMIAECPLDWQMSTGDLLAVLTRHYQNINCVKFTDEGSHLVSGADDSLVVVWALARYVIIVTGGHELTSPLQVMPKPCVLTYQNVLQVCLKPQWNLMNLGLMNAVFFLQFWVFILLSVHICVWLDFSVGNLVVGQFWIHTICLEGEQILVHMIDVWITFWCTWFWDGLDLKSGCCPKFHWPSHH